MRKKILAILLLSLLAIVAFATVMTARGVGEGEWIISYTVEDSETRQVLIEADYQGAEEKYIEYAPILGGANLTVTFTIDVFAGGSGNLRLITGMQHSTIESDRYWELVTKDYDLGDDFNPNSASTEFTWAMGNFTMRCYGKTPLISKPTALILVQISSASGDILDNIKPTVVTAVVDEFQNLYDQKEDKLRSLVSSGVAPGYTQLFENVLAQSYALSNLGYVDEAIALLNSLPNSGEPMGSALEMILIPGIGIGAVVAVVFAFMFLRTRGQNSYAKMVIEDQIKDLEGLTLRVARIDRRLSSSLESVKDRLKSLVGM